jgi:tetratricopeptide (TPR) repeat protein
MASLTRRSVSFFFVSIAFAFSSAHAQDQWTWPEKPKNLQVLKDFTGQRLRPVMTGFTRALGVRCSYCHVGEEGKPLSTYDFASDANLNKDRAREMLRMLGSINDHLKKIEPSGKTRVNMWCHTCHQGRPRPTTLEEELNEAYARSGVTAAVARYRELRERFYGKGGYDFSERSLNAFAYELLGKKDYDGGIAIFRLNASEFPQSGNVWDSLAEAYLAAGKSQLAEIYYRKSLEIDPQNENAAKKLREIEGKPREP